jgi:hypothetical protein
MILEVNALAWALMQDEVWPMGLPTVIFQNNYTAAHAVRDHVDSVYPTGRPFAVRPYQFQAPDFTDWLWYPRSGHWPAQRHSKLFIGRYRQDPDCLYAGYFVERGHGQQVVAADPGFDKKLIMQSDWYWFEFLRHAEARELDAPIMTVLERSQLPVTITADLWHYRPPDDDLRPRQPDDCIQFETSSAEGPFANVKKSQGMFKRLTECANLQQLAARLDGWDELDWYWINLFIGIKLRYGTEETGTWGAPQLWRNALEPWAAWVH